jgi:hypothetical protein
MVQAPRKERFLQALVSDSGGLLVTRAVHDCITADDLMDIDSDGGLLTQIKDEADWKLIGDCVAASQGEQADAMKDSYQRIDAEEEGDHHYHMHGWRREVWLQSLADEAGLAHAKK